MTRNMYTRLHTYTANHLFSIMLSDARLQQVRAEACILLQASWEWSTVSHKIFTPSFTSVGSVGQWVELQIIHGVEWQRHSDIDWKVSMVLNVNTNHKAY